MSTTTIYDVKLRYSVDGRGAAGVRGITNEVKALSRESGLAGKLMTRLGAAAAGVFGIREGYKALIGFNSTVQDTKQQIAGMLALTKKTDLADQITATDRLYAHLQKRAKSLPGTTMEYTQMLGAITQPITDAGGGLKDLEDMTVNSVVAAKALRVQWDVAARDIDQALRGQFHSVDQFTGKILGSVGYKGEEGRAKYNAMSAQDRLEVLRGAVLQKQLTQLAAAQGDSFSGLLSTLQSTAQEFFGKVGLPVFKAISVEIKRWNTWLDANEDKVDAFAQKLADGLVRGFGYVKDVITFVVDHADTLVNLGKIWLAVKVGQGIGGGVSSLQNMVGAGEGNTGTGLKGLIGWFRGSRDKFNPETGGYEYTKAGRGRQAVGGLSGAADNAGMLATSLAVGYSIGTIINQNNQLSDSIAGVVRVNGEVLDATDSTTSKFIQLQRSMDALDEATQRAAKSVGGPRAVTNMIGSSNLAGQQANAIRDYLNSGDMMTALQKKTYAQSLGLTDEDLTAQKATAYQQRAAAMQGRGDAVGIQTALAMQGALMLMTDYQKRTLDEQKATADVSAYIAQHLDKGNASLTDILHLILGATEDPTGKKSMKMSQKPNVNITISRIEVQSEDPDRYAFGLVEAFRDAVKNPSQAVRTIREG